MTAWRIGAAERKKARLAAGFRDDDDLARSLTVGTTALGGVMKAHVPLPSEEEMKQKLLERRKQALLDKLA